MTMTKYSIYNTKKNLQNLYQLKYKTTTTMMMSSKIVFVIVKMMPITRLLLFLFLFFSFFLSFLNVYCWALNYVHVNLALYYKVVRSWSQTTHWRRSKWVHKRVIFVQLLMMGHLTIDQHFYDFASLSFLSFFFGLFFLWRRRRRKRKKQVNLAHNLLHILPQG